MLESGSICDNCPPESRTFASHYCPQCNSNFCSACVETTHSLRVFRSHNFELIPELSKKNVDSAVMNDHTNHHEKSFQEADLQSDVDLQSDFSQLVDCNQQF